MNLVLLLWKIFQVNRVIIMEVGWKVGFIAIGGWVCQTDWKGVQKSLKIGRKIPHFITVSNKYSSVPKVTIADIVKKQPQYFPNDLIMIQQSCRASQVYVPGFGFAALLDHANYNYVTVDELCNCCTSFRPVNRFFIMEKNSPTCSQLCWYDSRATSSFIGPKLCVKIIGIFFGYLAPKFAFIHVQPTNAVPP